MLDDFMVRAALAGIGVALAAGPLGCFVVWRRIAYFGDATAHAAILGVALSLLFSVSTFVGVLAVAMAVALTVSVLSGRGIAMDTLLGVVSQAGLAFGIVAVALAARRPVQMEAFLFGELLAVTRTDLAIIWGGAVLVLALLIWRWSALLTSTLSADLARGSGIVPEREQLALMVGLAVVVAGLDQGRRCAADHRNADHPGRHRPPVLANSRNHGGERHTDRCRIRHRRACSFLVPGHPDGPYHRDTCFRILRAFDDRIAAVSKAVLNIMDRAASSDVALSSVEHLISSTNLTTLGARTGQFMMSSCLTLVRLRDRTAR